MVIETDAGVKMTKHELKESWCMNQRTDSSLVPADNTDEIISPLSQDLQWPKNVLRSSSHRWPIASYACESQSPARVSNVTVKCLWQSNLHQGLLYRHIVLLSFVPIILIGGHTPCLSFSSTVTPSNQRPDLCRPSDALMAAGFTDIILGVRLRQSIIFRLHRLYKQTFHERKRCQ